MHAEALDHAQAARDGAVAHGPHHHVQGFGHQRDEVPEGVVCAARLGVATVGLHLHGVHEVGELHRVLDEEHRNVVAHDVPVALLRVQLDGEAAHVARRVHRTGAAGHGGKAREHRGLHAHFGQHARGGEFGQRFGQLEVAVCGRAAGMHDALGNALMVEVRDLLAQDEVFEQRGAAWRVAQRVLVVGDRNALLGRHHRVIAAGLLLQFVTIAALGVGGRGGGKGRTWLIRSAADGWGLGHGCSRNGGGVKRHLSRGGPQAGVGPRAVLLSAVQKRRLREVAHALDT